MNTSMNGRSIECIDLNPMWTQSGNPERIWAREGLSLRFAANHHGDHDSFWVVVTECDREIARYNANAIQHIRWLPAVSEP
jgi:hypothetical protein